MYCHFILSIYDCQLPNVFDFYYYRLLIMIANKTAKKNNQKRITKTMHTPLMQTTIKIYKKIHIIYSNIYNILSRWNFFY